MSDIAFQGMIVSEGVLDIIISKAAAEVPGVLAVGMSGVTGNLKSLFATKQQVPGVEITVNDNEELEIGVHVEVEAGLVLPDVATLIRTSVADAVSTQIGAKVAAVDVYVEGLRFA